jgi:hypothetical protein
MNKLSKGRHVSVGPSQPESSQLIDIGGEKMEMVYEADPFGAKPLSAVRRSARFAYLPPGDRLPAQALPTPAHAFLRAGPRRPHACDRTRPDSLGLANARNQALGQALRRTPAAARPLGSDHFGISDGSQPSTYFRNPSPSRKVIIYFRSRPCASASVKNSRSFGSEWNRIAFPSISRMPCLRNRPSVRESVSLVIPS